MKVSFKDFGPHVPDKDRYECGIDYLHHDLDLELEDAFYLVSQLKHNRSSVAIYTTSTVVDFSIDRDGLSVQIDGDSTWVASDLDLDVAKEILKAILVRQYLEQLSSGMLTLDEKSGGAIARCRTSHLRPTSQVLSLTQAAFFAA